MAARIAAGVAAGVARVARTAARQLHRDAAVRGMGSVPKKVWNLGRLNHIAIATPDLNKSTELFRDILGADVSEPQALPDHGVRTVFINLGNTKLELLHPLGPDSPITGFLKKNPSGGMHHICIEVDDIFEAVAALQKQQIRCLNDPRPGAHGQLVVFLHPKDCAGVLVELEEA